MAWRPRCVHEHAWHNAFLHEVFSYSNPSSPAEVLEILRQKVKQALGQKKFKGETKDGMDMAICFIDRVSSTLIYAGAYNPLFLIRVNELLEFEATRNPFGIHIKDQPIRNEVIQYKANDKFDIFSDGFADRVNGQTGQKFKLVEFKRLLLANANLSMDEQR